MQHRIEDKGKFGQPSKSFFPRILVLQVRELVSNDSLHLRRDIELTSSGDTATTFRPLLSKEKALPTVASLRSTPVMLIFLQRSAHVSLSLEPAKSPAIIPSRILGNAYLRATRDIRETIPKDASSELPNTSLITRCG